ncbi:MAG: photosystem II reaction center PsbP family protein, partial [Gemmatimonadota bacterium]|nr:photosystem II reaction center PsbP family protein [Gemmatimonadota bacterium]
MLRVRLSTALLLATLCASASQLSAQRGQPYRDPNGRFSLTIPDDWNSIAQNGSVTFTNGSVSLTVTPFSGVQSPDQIAGALSQQMSQQWRNLQLINKGEFQVGGAPAYYVMYNGMSPRGTPSVLRLVGLMRGSEEYAFIISSPTSEFQNAKGFLQAMEMSFSYGRGGGRGNTDDPQFPQQPRQYPQQQPQQQPQFPQPPPQQDPQQPRNQPQFPQQQPQFPQQQPQFPQQQPPMASSTGKASMGVALRNLDKD